MYLCTIIKVQTEDPQKLKLGGKLLNDQWAKKESIMKFGKYCISNNMDATKPV